MALVRELQDHGCSLRGSVICKFIKGDVTRCAACEYKKMTDEQRTQVAVDYYIAEELLECYPITVAADDTICELCRGGKKNPATTKAYAKITNKALDVKRDLAGSGGRINGGEIDIEVPACKACMKNIRKIKLFHYAVIAVIIALIGTATYAMNVVYPTSGGLLSMFEFLGCCVVGIGMYVLAMRGIKAAVGKKTYVHVLDLPALRGFKQKGWYVRRAGRVLPTLHRDPPVSVVDELKIDEQEKAYKDARKRKRMERMREI